MSQMASEWLDWRLNGICRVFVDGRDRAAIMEDMKFRIERHDGVAERNAAIKVRLVENPIRTRPPNHKLLGNV